MDFYKALEDLISLFQFTSETVPIDQGIISIKITKTFFFAFCGILTFRKKEKDNPQKIIIFEKFAH